MLADLVGAGTRFVAAQGGKGGLGNAALASPRRKAPGFALRGEPGEEHDLVLELKTHRRRRPGRLPQRGQVLADRRDVGGPAEDRQLPVHHADPEPGRGRGRRSRSSSSPTCPGLIPGASEGKGLGLEFLRHVERCAVLVHVIDCATEEPGRDPLTDLDVIEAELAAYDELTGADLAGRPRIVALNKIDVPDGPRAGRPGPARSRGARAAGLRGLRGHPRGPARAGVRHGRAGRRGPGRGAGRRSRRGIVIRPAAVDDAGLRRSCADRRRQLPRARASKPERWVRQTDFTNDEAVGYLADRLARLGVEEALAKAGRRAPGAEVMIGDEDDPVGVRLGARASSAAGSRRRRPARHRPPAALTAPATADRTPRAPSDRRQADTDDGMTGPPRSPPPAGSWSRSARRR